MKVTVELNKQDRVHVEVEKENPSVQDVLRLVEAGLRQIGLKDYYNQHLPTTSDDPPGYVGGYKADGFRG